MLHDNPKRHIRLQIICTIIILIGAAIRHIDWLIGTVLVGCAVTVFALDLLYLASDDNGKH